MERVRSHPIAEAQTKEKTVAGEGFVRSAVTVEPDVLVPMSKSFSLERGETIAAPEGTYTIEREVGRGGEGVSYLATLAGAKKVLKVQRENHNRSLERTLHAELMRVNTALDADMRLIKFNPFDYALVRDYVEGDTLNDHLKNTNRTFTQREALSMIENVVREYLTPLHEQQLIHRDIKPNNLIVQAEGDVKKYTLIDFGLMRENGADATITLNLRGTPGYSRFTAEHSVKDDYYGLAETALFVLSGKHPTFIGTPELDKAEDENRIGKMPLTPAFKSLLLQMLGHRGEFTSTTALLDAIEKTKRGFNGSADTSIDLASAAHLVDYRKRATPPETLLAEIEGIKAIFKEEYQKSLPERHPLTKEYTQRLQSTLARLGYAQDTKRTSLLASSDNGGAVFVRRRKESSSMDVFVTHTAGANRFRLYSVNSDRSLDSLVTTTVTPQSIYRDAQDRGMVLQIATPIFVGAHLGAMTGEGSGIAVGALAGALVGIGSAAIGSEAYHTADDTAWKGLLPWNLHHLYAKTVYHLNDWKNKLGDAYTRGANSLGVDDAFILQRALTPAPLFTYEERVTPVSSSQSSSQS